MNAQAPQRPVARSAPQLLADARVVLNNPGAVPTASWSRAVALLGRQAIERGLTDLWSSVEPGLGSVRQKRAQFICLRWYLDPALAGQTHYAWAALSGACHHHVYDLCPTEAELRSWLATTERFLRAVGESMNDTSSRGHGADRIPPLRPRPVSSATVRAPTPP